MPPLTKLFPFSAFLQSIITINVPSCSNFPPPIVLLQVQYHADFEKQKGHKTSVAEDPEIARIKQNTAIQSNINYWGVKEQRSAMEEKRPHEAVDEGKESWGRRGVWGSNLFYVSGREV